MKDYFWQEVAAKWIKSKDDLNIPEVEATGTDTIKPEDLKPMSIEDLDDILDELDFKK